MCEIASIGSHGTEVRVQISPGTLISPGCEREPGERRDDGSAMFSSP